MKVNLLKQGMLLKAKIDLRPASENERTYTHHSNIATMRFRYSPLYSDSNTTVFMYLGAKIDKYKWDGAYKHHRVLYCGKILHLSGYDVKNIEPVD